MGDTNLLCNGVFDQEIKIDFFKSSKSGDHKHIGTSYTDIYTLLNGEKKLKVKNETVEIVNFEIKKSANFLEYVFGGCNINLEIAIDFTLSNGDPKDPQSLHHGGRNPN